MDTPVAWNFAAVRPVPAGFAWEPLPALGSALAPDDAEIADCRGKRIGILIVAYNAVSTLAGVPLCITPDVWRNVGEIAAFDAGTEPWGCI